MAMIKMKILKGQYCEGLFLEPFRGQSKILNEKRDYGEGKPGF